MMALTLNDRDKWLCVVLPVVLTVLTYSILAARPLLRDCRGAQAELARQDPPSVRAARLETARAEKVRLNDALATERTRATVIHGSTASTTASSSSRRVAALAEISRRCEECKMTMLCTAPEPGVAAGKEEFGSGEQWRLELRGPYEGMAHLLDALTSGDHPVMPVRLDMMPAADDGKPIDWVLTVRI